MSWLTRSYKQTVTRWTSTGMDVYGKRTWSVSTMKCRWEEGLQESVDTLGNRLISSAIVFVPTDVSPGDYLYLGTSVATAPIAGAREVKNFFRVPSLRNDVAERKAVLK